MKKIIKKYPKARLETCGQKKIGNRIKSHAKGCYIRLNNNEVKYSNDELWIIVDFDKNKEICALEFVDGLPYKRRVLVKSKGDEKICLRRRKKE